MKKIAILFLGFIIISCNTGKNTIQDNTFTIITEKVNYINKNVGFQIEKIISDSRCPENVTCVKGGDVRIVLGIYNNNHKTEEIEMIIDHLNLIENRTYFNSKIRVEGKTISNVFISPTKKNWDKIDNKNYLLQLKFTDK